MALAAKANKLTIVDAFKKNWREMTMLVASACPGIHVGHTLEIALENGLDEEISILVDTGCVNWCRRSYDCPQVRTSRLVEDCG